MSKEFKKGDKVSASRHISIYEHPLILAGTPGTIVGIDLEGAAAVKFDYPWCISKGCTHVCLSVELHYTIPIEEKPATQHMFKKDDVVMLIEDLITADNKVGKLTQGVVLYDQQPGSPTVFVHFTVKTLHIQDGARTSDWSDDSVPSGIREREDIRSWCPTELLFIDRDEDITIDFKVMPDAALDLAMDFNASSLALHA